MKQTEEKPLEKYTKRRKVTDFISGGGMVLIAIGLLIPLLNLSDTSMLPICKWVFTTGVLLCLGAKCVVTYPPSTSFRLRRLKRLEFWASVCFAVGAGFWFYNESKFSGIDGIGALSIIRDTILFTLSGAIVQLIAAWLIYFREKKEAKESRKENNADIKKG